MIRAALRRVGVYMYCLPTFRQARLTVFESITNDSKKFLDYIPKSLIKSINSQELKVVFNNGSIIQFIGSDSYDTSLVGTNPRMVIMSEYALSDERAYHYIRPILNANGGSMILLSTPRGRNHLWDLYNIAVHNPNEWFCSKLTLDDTRHIPLEEIQKEIDSGEISEEFAQQEYFTSFELGIEGSIYGKHIDQMRLTGRIGQVPWDSSKVVHTMWDIGRDMTSIIFYQTLGNVINIIDCYEESKQELPYFARYLDTKPYKYGKHYIPHDGSHIEWGGGLSRFALGAQVGIKFETREGGRLSAIPKLEVATGIEYGRILLTKLWIDETRCQKLIKALENYHYKVDHKRKVNSTKPEHDIYSHFADSFRYLATIVAMDRGHNTSIEDLERRYLQTVDGQQNIPSFFRDDYPTSSTYR